MIRPSLQQVRYKKHVSQLPQPSGQSCYRHSIQLEAAATGTLAERNLLVSPLYPATEPPLRAHLFATVHPLAKALVALPKRPRSSPMPQQPLKPKGWQNAVCPLIWQHHCSHPPHYRPRPRSHDRTILLLTQPICTHGFRLVTAARTLARSRSFASPSISADTLSSAHVLCSYSQHPLPHCLLCCGSLLPTPKADPLMSLGCRSLST